MPQSTSLHPQPARPATLPAIALAGPRAASPAIALLARLAASAAVALAGLRAASPAVALLARLAASVAAASAALLVLVLTGCADTAVPQPAATPEQVTSASVSSSAAAPAVDDPPGTIACARLTQAITDGSLMDAGVVDAITAATATADAPLADAAHRLANAYAAALTAKGAATEPDAIAAVSAAAADLDGVCADSGLRTNG